MSDFGVRDVERMLRMPRSAILGLVRAGFVSPARGERREYRFSFQDLIVLRTARALRAAKVPARRITRSLRDLRRRLPESVPLSGLRISALGDSVVVAEGGARWQAESGQYVLELDVSVADGELKVLARDEPPREADAEDWFRRGTAAESRDAAESRQAYELALALDPAHVSARLNLGRLLHEAAQFFAAERVYREGLRVVRQSSDAALQPRRAAPGRRAAERGDRRVRGGAARGSALRRLPLQPRAAARGVGQSAGRDPAHGGVPAAGAAGIERCPAVPRARRG